jgi:NodT family efflux transporter outer membrane factor (OMF) lipoprotein
MAMTSFPFPRLTALAAAVTILAGCANYAGISSDHQLAAPNAFATQQSLPAEGGRWPDVDWAASFGDPQLPKLIDEALAGNPTIADAQARVAQAAAYAEGANATRFPNLGVRASSNREIYSANGLFPPPEGGTWFTENSVLLNASYDLDLWGKNSQGLAQAISTEKAASAQAQEARLTLAVAVARAYNELAREYAQRDIAAREIQQRRDVGSITIQRIAAGLDTQVERNTSDANIASTDTLLAQLDGQIVATRYQLGALLGKGPDRGLSIATPALVDHSLHSLRLPDDLPANLLSRRPDVVAARWQVDAMMHGIRVAKADFYPDINLAAVAGFDAFGVGRLFTAGSRQIQAGPAISLPIFDAGALRAQLKGRYAEFDGAVANYNHTLTQAFNDVATQVAAIHSTDAQIASTQVAYDAAERAYRLAVVRYRGGLGTQLQVLSADVTLLSQEQTLVALQMNRRDQQFGLIEALGGGFNAQSAGLATPDTDTKQVAANSAPAN